MIYYWPIALTLGILALIVSCVLICGKELARKVPVNYVLLFVFTVSEAYLVAYGNCYYDRTTVFCAALTTFVMVVGLTVYAFTTKQDFTIMRGGMFVFGFSLMIFGLIVGLMNVYWLNMVFVAIAVILFGFYLIYDT